MRRFFIFAITLGAVMLLSLSSSRATFAQQQQGASKVVNSGQPVDTERIIRAFTAKEAEFRTALNNYGFKRDAVMQTIGMGGQITGEYHRVSNFTFDNSGNRYEKITFFPMPTLLASVTPEDLEDLAGVNQFALEVSKINQYNFTYVGKEKIDELDLYVFDVAPKVVPSPKTKERLFVGRIWVDDQDLQIVKTRGKGVPETKQNKFAVVETYRQQIDGRYWFPTYAYADDELVFDNGNVLHIRIRVLYTDYKVGRGDVRIIEGDIIDETETKPAPKPSPSPNKP